MNGSRYRLYRANLGTADESGMEYRVIDGTLMNREISRRPPTEWQPWEARGWARWESVFRPGEEITKCAFRKRGKLRGWIIPED